MFIFHVIESEGEVGSVDKDRDMSVREVHNDNVSTNIHLKKFTIEISINKDELTKYRNKLIKINTGIHIHRYGYQNKSYTTETGVGTSVTNQRQHLGQQQEQTTKTIFYS